MSTAAGQESGASRRGATNVVSTTYTGVEATFVATSVVSMGQEPFEMTLVGAEPLRTHPTQPSLTFAA
jgi:hypothetical protein